MASIHAASYINTPDGQLQGPSGPQVSLGSLMKPMKDVWPAVDATNGPITADSGIVAGTPSTSGLTLYAWDSGMFNTQSQSWVVTPTGANQNTSGFSACMNASTPRIHTFGSLTNYPLESNIDFSFVTDATTITLFYFVNGAYSGNTYHDHQIYAEYNGSMRKLTMLPATFNASNGVMYRTITFKEAREREMRVMLPMNGWLIGVYINTTATIRKAPNKMFVITNGDSWNEPGGNILASPIGGAWPTGTYRVGGMSQMIAEATGWAVGLCAEGGTGEFNCNDGQSRDPSYTDGGGTSVFHGHTRIDDMATKFFAKSPLVWTIGGWNDGSHGGTPYKDTYYARVLQGIDYFVSKKSDIKLMYSGIQPVDITAGDMRTLSVQGQAQACAERPNSVIGFIDEMPMWPDTTMSGQRGANVNSTDTIHLHIKGAELVANWHLAAASKFTIPLDYYNKMLAA